VTAGIVMAVTGLVLASALTRLSARGR